LANDYEIATGEYGVVVTETIVFAFAYLCRY